MKQVGDLTTDLEFDNNVSATRFYIDPDGRFLMRRQITDDSFAYHIVGQFCSYYGRDSLISPLMWDRYCLRKTILCVALSGLFPGFVAAQTVPYSGLGTRMTIRGGGSELYDEYESESARDGQSNPALKTKVEIPLPGVTMIGEFEDRIIGGRQVKLYSRAQIISSIEAADSYSVAVFNDATLRDEITIPPPPGTGIANGTIGTMDVNIGVDGTWTTEAVPLTLRNPDNKVHVRWRILGNKISNGQGQIIDFGNGPSAIGGDMELRDEVGSAGDVTGTPLAGGASFKGTISFNYGEPFILFFRITANAEADFNAPRSGSALAEIDMGNTVNILPFSNFMADVDGNGEFELTPENVTVTSVSGYDYLAPLPPSISVSNTGEGIELNWDVGTLESSDIPQNGNWSEEIGVTSPFPLNPTGDQKFFRLRLDN